MAKRHGLEFWRAHLAAWRRSDLTQRKYCANQGLDKKAFYRWRRKEREAVASAKSALALIPVSIVPISVGAAVTGSVVRLHNSPGGWSAPWLAGLLRQPP
jgi:hypothetical protein